MILLDTSIWIEFFRQNPDYVDTVEAFTENGEAIAVEPVFGELLQGARNKKEIAVISAYYNALIKAPVDNIFIDAGIYSHENKLIDRGVGLIDATLIILATRMEVPVWTLDKNLKRVLPSEYTYD
jgi:predicted nucleic acid-binding protein